MHKFQPFIAAAPSPFASVANSNHVRTAMVDGSFMIGEVEIGEQPFAEVTAFVNERLKDLGE